MKFRIQLPHLALFVGLAGVGIAVCPSAVAQESSPAQVVAPQIGAAGKSRVIPPADEAGEKQTRPTGGSSAPT